MEHIEWQVQIRRHHFFRSNAGQKLTYTLRNCTPNMRSSVHDSYDCSVVESVHNNAILGVLSPNSKLQNMSSQHWWAVGFFDTYWVQIVFWPISLLLLHYGVRLRSEKQREGGWPASRLRIDFYFFRWILVFRGFSIFRYSFCLDIEGFFVNWSRYKNH